MSFADSGWLINRMLCMNDPSFFEHHFYKSSSYRFVFKYQKEVLKRQLWWQDRERTSRTNDVMSHQGIARVAWTIQPFPSIFAATPFRSTLCSHQEEVLKRQLWWRMMSCPNKADDSSIEDCAWTIQASWSKVCSQPFQLTTPSPPLLNNTTTSYPEGRG